MMIEGRTDDGWPSYSLACVSCGLMYGPMRGGLTVARAALSDMWAWRDGLFYCPDDSPGVWQMPEIDVTPPPGYKTPDSVCGNCKTITGRRSGECRKCGQELRISSKGNITSIT